MFHLIVWILGLTSQCGWGSVLAVQTSVLTPVGVAVAEYGADLGVWHHAYDPADRRQPLVSSRFSLRECEKLVRFSKL